MNTPTITEMRDALASACVVDGLVSMSFMPDKPPTPCAIVMGPEATFNEDTLSDNYTFPVVILVGTPTQAGASEQLDAYLSRAGDKSVPRAIEADDTLGDVVQYAAAQGITDYGTHLVQNVEYLGATILVTVVAYRAMQ